MPRGIGRMPEQLVIRKNTPTDDGQLGTDAVWSTLDSIDAEYIPTAAAENLRSEKITTQIAASFRTRARADITTAMRIYWTPAWPPSAPREIFEIHGIEPDPDDREFMYLRCGSTEETE